VTVFRRLHDVRAATGLDRLVGRFGAPTRVT
jgi:hypothetical protein